MQGPLEGFVEDLQNGKYSARDQNCCASTLLHVSSYHSSNERHTLNPEAKWLNQEYLVSW